MSSARPMRHGRQLAPRVDRTRGASALPCQVFVAEFARIPQKLSRNSGEFRYKNKESALEKAEFQARQGRLTIPGSRASLSNQQRSRTKVLRQIGPCSDRGYTRQP